MLVYGHDGDARNAEWCGRVLLNQQDDGAVMQNWIRCAWDSVNRRTVVQGPIRHRGVRGNGNGGKLSGKADRGVMLATSGRAPLVRGRNIEAGSAIIGPASQRGDKSVGRGRGRVIQAAVPGHCRFQSGMPVSTDTPDVTERAHRAGQQAKDQQALE